MTTILHQQFWMLRACALLTILFGVSACQATFVQFSAAAQRVLDAGSFKRFDDMITIVRSNYIEPVSMERLLTLALNGMEGTHTFLPPGAHEILQNSIRTVAAAGNEQAQLVAFTEGISLLAGGDSGNSPRLLRMALTGMAHGLDPHSDFNFFGPGSGLGSIGLIYEKSGSEIAVVETVPNASATLAGIQPGDVIVEIDGQPIRTNDFKGLVYRLSGPLGSSVQLLLRRTGQADPLSFRLVRQKLRQPVLTFGVRDGVALIRPWTFNPELLHISMLREALVDVTTRAGGRLSGLVLDLRNNKRGLFNEDGLFNEGGVFDKGSLFSVATEMAGLLLQAGDLVVTLKGRNAADNSVITASGGSLSADMPMVVLVGSETASGAELVAAALGDSRALLLGSRTFGVGTLQTMIKVRDGFFGVPNYVRLTTAQMFGPNGHSWQRRGLTPDIAIQPATGIDSKHLEYSLPGALPAPPDIAAPTRPNPLRARLAQITPSLLPTPNPTNPNTDFAVEQALRAISLLQPTAAP